jgi:hypothetical protein
LRWLRCSVPSATCWRIRAAITSVTLAGLADAHSGAISAALLERNGILPRTAGQAAVLLSFTANALTKIVKRQQKCMLGGTRILAWSGAPQASTIAPVHNLSKELTMKHASPVKPTRTNPPNQSKPRSASERPESHAVTLNSSVADLAETIAECRYERREAIAVAAYYRAQCRGFAPGYELEDWLAAETQMAGN